MAFSDSAPDWRILNSVLNLTGNCKNKNCVAYNKEVTCPKGLGVYDFIMNSNTALCHMCKIPFILFPVVLEIVYIHGTD